MKRNWTLAALAASLMLCTAVAGAQIVALIDLGATTFGAGDYHHAFRVRRFRDPQNGATCYVTTRDYYANTVAIACVAEVPRDR